MYSSTRELIKEFEAEGELARIRAIVSPILEITEITDRISKSPCPVLSEEARRWDPNHHGQGGKALFFERVADCDFPLLINAFGSYSRLERALGAFGHGGLTAIADRIASLVKPELPRNLGEAWAMGRRFLPLLRIGPRMLRHAPCQEVVRLTARAEVDLTRLPLLKCWPLDGDPQAVGYPTSSSEAGTALGKGRYITFAGMHTIHADHRDDPKPPSHNIGMYRAQLIDRTHLAMHWHMHHDGAAHWRSWKKLGQRMPIAICLGGESVMAYGATAPLPPGISELLMCGFLNGRGIPMVNARTVPLRVPANSEIVIEGWVDTECGFPGWDPRNALPQGDNDLGPGGVFEGPFGDHTGFYSLPDRYPLVEVTAITHRRDAVYPTTIVGLPPQEDYYLGKATERIFLPLLKTIVPDILDYHLPMFGVFHNCAFVQIRKAYPLQARRIMHAVWGAGQMSWTKMIIVVDDDVDVHDDRAVLQALFQHCDFGRDVEIVRGPLDILDHAAPHLGAGGKMGLDATAKREDETIHAGLLVPPAIDALDASRYRTIEGVTGVHSPELSRHRALFLGVQECCGQAVVEEAMRVAEASGPDLLVAFDTAVNIRRIEPALFHLCANADFHRDVVRRGRRLGIDATRKARGVSSRGEPVRDYPPLIAMTDEIKSLVDRRWAEYEL